MRRDLSKMARGPAAAAAVGRDGPPGLEGVLEAEGRPLPVPVLRIADIVAMLSGSSGYEVDAEHQAWIRGSICASAVE